jgi:hypothetical protein
VFSCPTTVIRNRRVSAEQHRFGTRDHSTTSFQPIPPTATLTRADLFNLSQFPGTIQFPHPKSPTGLASLGSNVINEHPEQLGSTPTLVSQNNTFGPWMLVRTSKTYYGTSSLLLQSGYHPQNRPSRPARSFTVTGTKYPTGILNTGPVNLLGGCDIAGYTSSARSSPDDAQERRLRLKKNVHCNKIHISINTPSYENSYIDRSVDPATQLVN